MNEEKKQKYQEIISMEEYLYKRKKRSEESRNLGVQEQNPFLFMAVSEFIF